MKKNYFSLLSFFFIAFASCNSDSEKAGMILQSVENIVEQYPDSAYHLLDSIDNPYELNEGQQAKYFLLSVESKYKAEKDISKDSLIFKAKDYFKKSKDIKRWALATFYSGRVLEALQKPQEALNAFLEAESIAISAQNASLTGFIQYNIGVAYYQNGLYDEAIGKFKQAAENFARQPNDYKKEIMALDYIGTNYAINNNIDSALFYFNNALSKAINYNDFTERVYILLNMGATFSELGKNDEAKVKLIEAQKFSNDIVQQAKINLNLANVYFANSRLDSATFYITRSMELAKKTNDKTMQASIFYYLSQLDEKKGNYKASLEHHKKYAECVFSTYDEMQKTNYLDVQKKYDFEQMRIANAKLLIDKQKILILFLISILALFVVAFLFYRKKKLDEKVIWLAEHEIYQLKEIVSKPTNTLGNGTSEINNKLREMLATRFGILKRIALLEDTLSKDDKEKGKGVLKRVYGIIYGHEEYDWSVLIRTINDLFEGYTDQLHSIAPDLSETDFRICCLSKAKLSNSEIAGLLKTTVSAIQMRKNHIRTVLKMQKQTNFSSELDRVVYSQNKSL